MSQMIQAHEARSHCRKSQMQPVSGGGRVSWGSRAGGWGGGGGGVVYSKCSEHAQTSEHNWETQSLQTSSAEVRGGVLHFTSSRQPVTYRITALALSPLTPPLPLPVHSPSLCRIITQRLRSRSAHLNGCAPSTSRCQAAGAT